MEELESSNCIAPGRGRLMKAKAVKHEPDIEDRTGKLAYLQQAVSDTFDTASLEQLRAELWIWLKAVTNNRPWSFKGDPSAVLQLEKLFRGMVSVAEELLTLDNESDEETSTATALTIEYIPYSPQRIGADIGFLKDQALVLKSFQGKIRRLQLEETKHPAIFLRRFFSYQNPDAWYKTLKEWLFYGLSTISISEVKGTYTALTEYELLEGLLEAIYLFHNEGKHTECV